MFFVAPHFARLTEVHDSSVKPTIPHIVTISDQAPGMRNARMLGVQHDQSLSSDAGSTAVTQNARTNRARGDHRTRRQTGTPRPGREADGRVTPRRRGASGAPNRRAPCGARAIAEAYH